MNIKEIVNKLSYLQYPLLLLALYFTLKPFIFYDIENSKNFESILSDINNSLAIIGLSIGFSTLQDTTKVQNKLSLQVYQSKKKSKIFIGYLIGLVLFFMISGILGLIINIKFLNTLSLGLISLGIGMLGMLKSASEMAEYQWNLIQDRSKS